MGRIVKNTKNIVFTNEWLAAVILGSWTFIWMITATDWTPAVQILFITSTWTLTYFVVSIVVDNVKAEVNDD